MNFLKFRAICYGRSFLKGNLGCLKWIRLKLVEGGRTFIVAVMVFQKEL